MIEDTYYNKDKPVSFEIISSLASFEDLWVIFSRGQFAIEIPHKSVQAFGTYEDLIKCFGKDITDTHAMSLKDYFTELNRITYHEHIKKIFQHV